MQLAADGICQLPSPLTLIDAPLPHPRFAGGPTGYPGPTTPCATLNGSMPRTVAGENVEWSAEERIYSSTNVPCDDGNQTWAGYYYPGVITQHPTGTEDMSIKGKFKVS